MKVKLTKLLNYSSCNFRLRYFLFTLLLIILAFVTFFIYAFIVSHGEMDLFKREYMGINYVNTWDQLLKGRFDLDPNVIDFGETFIRNGKRYIYFGPFPAFLRGFFKVFPNSRHTDWSRISCIIGSIVVLITSTLAYWKITGISCAVSSSRWFYTSIFALGIGFGSFLVVLLASAYIFDESKIWGLANSCIFISAFVYFWFSNKKGLFLPFVMSLSSGFALLSQATFGVFPILMSVSLGGIVLVSYLNTFFKCQFVSAFLKWLGWNGFDLSRTKALFTCLTFILPLFLCICFQMKLNYEKMGNPFVMKDFRYYELCQGNKGRLELWLSWGLLNYLRIPHALTYYFVPRKEHFSSDFPFINIVGYENIFKFKDAWFDMIEPGNPTEVTTPYLFLNSILGVFFLVSTFGGIGVLLIVLLFISSALFLSYQGISVRYAVDLMPMFIIFSLGAFKLIYWLDRRNIFFKFYLRLSLLLLVMLSIYTANITMLMTKLSYWSVPETAKQPIRSFFENGNVFASYIVSNILNNNSVLKINREALGDFPSFPSLGQLWSPDGNKTVFWYDGRYWNLIKDTDGSQIGPIALQLLFNWRPGISEPILASGLARMGDTLYVRYLEYNKAVIGFDFWGSHGFLSEPFIVDPDHVYLLEISFGSFYDGHGFDKLKRRLLVKLDGRIILDKETPFHPVTLDQIDVGVNQTECGGCVPEFTGKILEARHLGKRVEN